MYWVYTAVGRVVCLVLICQVDKWGGMGVFDWSSGGLLCGRCCQRAYYGMYTAGVVALYFSYFIHDKFK